MIETPPDYPAGPLPDVGDFDDGVKAVRMSVLRDAPSHLGCAVAGLSEQQLDTKYKNWSIRQIVHHLADSHTHSYLRFKWTLAESHPTIKAYAESDWAELPDNARGEIQPSLALLEALHSKWLQVLSTMTPEQFARTFHHPQSGQTVSLWSALNTYAWHSQHHTGQILWLRQHQRW
jgi:hypothetical protein